MFGSWLEELDGLLGICSSDSIGENKLSLIQLDYIYTNIIQPYNLTSKMLLDQLLHNNSTVQSLAFFVLETSILKESMKTEKQKDFDDLCYSVSSALDVPTQNWDWMVISNNDQYKDYFYYRIRLLCAIFYKITAKEVITDQTIFLNLLASLSYHIHPRLPWTSELTSKTIQTFIEDNNKVIDMIHHMIPLYIDKKLKPELLDFSPIKRQSVSNSLSNPKLTPAGYAIVKPGGTRLLQSGLRPKLGYGGASTEIFTEDQRQKWKSSKKVKSISMIWFVIYAISKNEYLDQFWPIITSFILNLIDDHDPLMKVQSCELLHYFMDVTDNNDNYKPHIFLKTGLVDLLIDSCKTCLTYLPNLTPTDQSYHLLHIAYPTVIKLCALKGKKENNFLCLIELINENILNSMSHLFNRSGLNSNCPHLSLLFDQLNIIIKLYLKTNVLICFPRLNFTLNQVLSNPNLYEQGINGICCIKSALNVQGSIFESFKLLNDSEGLRLILNYKYDFLAIWSILKKRLKYNHPEYSSIDLLSLCDLNLKLLMQLSQNCQSNEFENLQADIKQIVLTNPDLQFPLE